LGHTFHDEVELMSGEAQGAARIAGEVSPLAGLLSRLEPERSVEPDRADTRHVRAPVPIDRRQPACMAIGATRPRSLCYPLGQAGFNRRPVDVGEPIEVSKICRFHDGVTDLKEATHRLGSCSVSGRVRYAGYGRRKILVTDGHEAEAKAAQLRKRPNRIGLFFLRVLGFRGEVDPPPTGRRGRSGPSHMHPVRDEHATSSEPTHGSN